MTWSLHRAAERNRPPAAARSAVTLGPGERLLAWACAQGSGTVVMASNHRVYAVSPEGELVLRRPWHEVDAAVWQSEDDLLTVTWVDGARPARWRFEEPTLLLETVRERVQASVVLAQRVPLEPRRSARVVIRQDLAMGTLLEQAILGRGVPATAPGVAEAVRAGLAQLREQVGLD